jgi:hypothetical protein
MDAKLCAPQRMSIVAFMTAVLQKLADAWKQRTILAKLFSFASIGVVNVVIDLSVFTICNGKE